MIQASQNLALIAKPPGHRFRVRSAAHYLDGHLALELIVVAYGAVDGAHASLADFTRQTIWTEASGPRGASKRGSDFTSAVGGLLKKRVGAFVGRQQRENLLMQIGPADAGLSNVRVPADWFQVECDLEDLLDLLPVFRRQSKELP
jgi:hypothetical protein